MRSACRELLAFIVKQLPVRLIFDDNYFNDRYQGILFGVYNKLLDGLLEGVESKTGVNFLIQSTGIGGNMPIN